MSQPQLIVLSGLLSGQVYPLLGEEITIGRERNNTISFPTDKRISARHARIRARLGLFWLEDLNSTNGTWLQPPVGQSRRLTPGEPVLLVESAYIRLANMITLQAQGLIAAQDEAFWQALARLHAFVEACYEQMAQFSDQERQEAQKRLAEFERTFHAIEDEADLMQLVNEQLTELDRTVVCILSEEALPPILVDLSEPGSCDRFASLHNLFLSRLQQLTQAKEERKE